MYSLNVKSILIHMLLNVRNCHLKLKPTVCIWFVACLATNLANTNRIENL